MTEEHGQSEDRPKQLVRLVKTGGPLGGARIGEQYEALHNAGLPRRDAVTRTFAMLKRDHPTENSMCWTVEGGISL